MLRLAAATVALLALALPGASAVPPILNVGYELICDGEVNTGGGPCSLNPPSDCHVRDRLPLRTTRCTTGDVIVYLADVQHDLACLQDWSFGGCLLPPHPCEGCIVVQLPRELP